jgi:hypothetical protein
MLLKNKKPASAWVYLDSVYKAHSVFPEMGYGTTNDAPYSWPGAKQAPVEKGGMAAAPPLPAGMRPMIAKPCLPDGAASTMGAKTAAAACPVAPAKPAVSPSAPAAAPPVPLPGYNSGTTTARVVPVATGGGPQ